MKREHLTEKILDIKRDRNWSWKHITSEIGGMSEILIVGALLGQMKLVKPLAKKAAQLFDLSEAEERMLNEVPYRGTPMPPTDPLLYRFFELVMVNGPAMKALIEEEFGDGIMWAIASNSRCRASSCPINIMAPNKAFRSLGTKRAETPPKRRRPAHAAGRP